MAKHKTGPPSIQELRSFGRTIGLIFAALAGIYFWRKGLSHFLTIIFAGLGGYLVIFSVVAPAMLTGFHRFWWKLAEFLGKYVGHYVGMAFFTLMYWVLFAPVAIIFRLVGFDPLGLNRFKKADTYWHARPTALSSKHYEKQFAVESKDHE